jgi:hypothetical protein
MSQSTPTFAADRCGCFPKSGGASSREPLILSRIGSPTTNRIPALPILGTRRSSPLPIEGADT